MPPSNPSAQSRVDRTPISYETVAADFSEARILISLPRDHLSTRQLINIIRSFELLLCLRAISSNGHLPDRWHTSYRGFLEKITQGPNIGARIANHNLKSQRGASSIAFEGWIASLTRERELFPIDQIRIGSYEFVLHAVNLAVVFGLQEYGLLKDVVQWVAGAVKDVINFVPDPIADPYSNKDNRPVTSAFVKSGPQAGLTLNADLVRALRGYDEVEMTEEIDGRKRLLRIKLSKVAGDQRGVA